MNSLFDRVTLAGLPLKNRFFRSAVWDGMADEQGRPTAQYLQTYRALAEGGVGSIITGYTYITEDEKPNHGMTGIYDDRFLEDYRTLTGQVHAGGAKIVLQLVYGGSQTNLRDVGRTVWGPSSVTNLVSGVTPKEMSPQELHLLARSFADAARRAKESGFDGVQLHAAHGYLLSQFLCPYYNRRTDRYGGSIENRARILSDILREVRGQVGRDYPVLVKLNSSDCADRGLSERDSLAAARLLAAWGIDGIEVSGGNSSFPEVVEQGLGASRGPIDGPARESYFRAYAERLSREVSVPVILCGGNRSLEVMEDILAHSGVFGFSLARPLIAEPGLIARWTAGDRGRPRCVSCSRCHGQPRKTCVLPRP